MCDCRSACALPSSRPLSPHALSAHLHTISHAPSHSRSSFVSPFYHLSLSLSQGKEHLITPDPADHAALTQYLAKTVDNSGPVPLPAARPSTSTAVQASTPTAQPSTSQAVRPVSAVPQQKVCVTLLTYPFLSHFNLHLTQDHTSHLT